MTCNPLRWLWGIVPLAMVWWIGLLGEQNRIEADLRARSEAALQQAGLTWAEASFRGREGVVSGRAAEESEQRQAASVVNKVWGVRSIEDRTDVLELVKNYLWQAHLRDGELRLTGYVPSDAARKAIIGNAKATFPGRKVEDQMKLARGAPSQNEWLGGTSFALKQLSQLKTGARATLESDRLILDGDAETVAGYSAIRTALAGGLPKGIGLKGERIGAPLIRPYTWAAAFNGQRVELTGHVPSEQQRRQIVAAVRQALPKAALEDRMVIGSGEPREWQKVTATAVAKLGQLMNGSAELRDSQLIVAGFAEREEIATAVRAALKSEIPSQFRLSEQIRQDPKLKAAEEAQRAAEAARRAAEEEARRRAAAAAAEEEARRRAAAAAAEEEARRRAAAAAAEEEARRRAAAAAAEEETRRRAASAAAEEETRRRAAVAAAEEARQRLTSDEAARQKAAEEAATRQRVAAAEEAQRRRAAEEAERQKAAAAAAEAARRAQAEAEARKLAEQKREAEEQARRLAAEQAERARVAAAAATARAAAARCETSLREAVKAGTINFARASADLDRKSHATLDTLANIVKTCPNAAIEVGGHTDNEGEPGRNQRLSERRAKAVADYLVKVGVPQSHIVAIGYGETQPIADNETSDGRARNRRIAFTVRAK